MEQHSSDYQAEKRDGVAYDSHIQACPLQSVVQHQMAARRTICSAYCSVSSSQVESPSP